ncbi:MAG: hypothetical protein QOF61_53 [Acidobacteriota bacterium]|jgi:ubiquinone/menaquinone biosynthesis C-methylase UbiE|nr:hypothetical protein [Acidobacteriota bacterium]
MHRLIKRAINSFEYRTGIKLPGRTPATNPFDESGRLIVGDNDAEVQREFFRYFTDLCGLKPEESVLDAGCGTGRLARPLADYLTGEYRGFDIVKSAVKECRREIGAHHPNFRFTHADIFNSSYNPKGKIRASRFRFPYPDASFDFIFLTSVFTHLLTEDTANYLHEVARVMKPTGRALVTFFLIDERARELIAAGKSHYRFGTVLPGCRVDSAAHPEDAVAYDERDALNMIAEAGLAVRELRFGQWRGAEGLSWQDILVVTRS